MMIKYELSVIYVLIWKTFRKREKNIELPKKSQTSYLKCNDESINLLIVKNKVMQISNMTSNDYFERGNSKAQLKDYKGAIEDYTMAIQLNPKNADAYNNRGISKKSLNDQEGAIEDYNMAIKLDPDYAMAYNNRGNSKKSLKDYKGAMEDYNLAIELNPFYVEAYFNRGISKNSLNDYKGAIQDYNTAIKLNPKYTAAYNNRGNIKKSLNDYKSAQSDFLNAINSSSQPSPLHIFNLANTYLDMGQKEEALKKYTEGVKVFRKETEANLKTKFKLSEGNINHIKSSIENFEKLTKQAEEIKRQAQNLNRPDVLQQLVKVNTAITSACIKSADEKADQTQTQMKMKALEEQLQDMRRMLKDQQKRIDTVEQKADKLQKEMEKFKAKVEQMGKFIYAEKYMLEKIDKIDSKKLTEFYKILYNMLINHFMAYRMLSTGFFTESVREVTTFDKIAGKVCQVQPIIESIPIIGDLVGIPFKILGMVREEKSGRLNSVIADKINGSNLQSEARITSYMSFLVKTLLDNKDFNTELTQAIKGEEDSFLNKAMDVLGSLKEKIYGKVFGGSTGEYSYVQQAVTLYMTRFTILLYEVKSDEFQKHTKNEKSFSEFFMENFGVVPKKSPKNNKESIQLEATNPVQAGSKVELNPSLEKSIEPERPPTCWQRFLGFFCCCRASEQPQPSS